MITIACCLWDANEQTLPFSRCYDETWVEKLSRGFQRNLTGPFRFVCFTDRDRSFMATAGQERLEARNPSYGALLEPFRLGVPMIVVGLDTVITGNIDHLAEYALSGGKPAVPRDPFYPETVCNGVVVAPAGWAPPTEGSAYDPAGFMGGDMQSFRLAYERGELAVLDDLWPGHVVSYKGHVKEHGLGDARIVYFHGQEKPHQVAWKEPWLGEHWI